MKLILLYSTLTGFNPGFNLLKVIKLQCWRQLGQQQDNEDNSTAGRQESRQLLLQTTVYTVYTVYTASYSVCTYVRMYACTHVRMYACKLYTLRLNNILCQLPFIIYPEPGAPGFISLPCFMSTLSTADDICHLPFQCRMTQSCLLNFDHRLVSEFAAITSKPSKNWSQHVPKFIGFWPSF